MANYPTGYSSWIADAELTAKHHGARWLAGTYSATIDNAIIFGQYEPWYGFRRLASHLGGDVDLETYAEAAEDAWRPFSTDDSGQVPGYYHYTDGFRVDWVQNADTVSRDALIDQAVSASYTTGSSSATMKDEFYSREVAYAVLGYINSEVFCATSHNTRMEPMLELILADVGASVNINGSTTLSAGGHIEQWLGSLTTNSSGDVTGGTHNFDIGGWDGSTPDTGVEQGFAPFMGAITGWTLIAHYENAASINGGITPDARIITKLVRLFDAMWAYYWVEADASMKYRWFEPDGVTERTDGAPALNNEMAPIYWWLFKQTGSIRHLQRGDALFNGTNGYESLTYRGVSTAAYLSKEFNELLRWTIDGLEWRAEGVDAVAAFTSKATGAWSATGQTTWNEVGAPAAGDTVFIDAGHVVTYDADITHTAAITVNGTLQGSGARVLTLSNTTLTVAAGGALTNTGGIFEIKIGAAHNQASAAVTIGASSGSRATVTGSSTSNYIKFTDGGFIRGGKVTAQRTDFSKVGTSASVASFTFWPNNTDTFSWIDCTFDADCGKLDNSSVIGSGTIFKVEDCTFLSTGTILGIQLANSAIGAGTRSVQRNWFGGTVGTSASGGQFYDVTFKHNVICGGLYTGDASDQPWSSSSGYNIIRWPGVSAMNVKQTTSTSLPWFLHIHNPSASISNCRGIVPTNQRNVTIAGWIIEPGDTDTVGDIIPAQNPGSARTWIVENNLLLPNKNGAHAGQFVSLLGGANTTFSSIAHNTWISDTSGGESGAISYGEAYAGRADLIGAIKSNLVWSPSAGGGYVFERRNLGTVADGCASGNVTHNGKWNLTTGNFGVGYRDAAAANMYSSGSPGANDVTLSADPFVDSSRRITTWAVARGYSVASDYATRSSDAYEALKTTPQTRIEDLIDYVQDGWKVTAATLNGTAHDGGVIGALGYQALGGSSYTSTAQGPLFSPAFSPANPPLIGIL